MHSYEIEIKVLLGDESAKNAFLERVRTDFPGLSLQYTEAQKNHYFEGGSLDALLSAFGHHISEEEKIKLAHIRDSAKNFSVRTRETPTETILVVKATVNDESSSNGTARIEWEVNLAARMNLEVMDDLVLSAGFSYQAKWSRAREGYTLNENTVLCLDKNAGYGYLAEFERVITDASLVESTRSELLTMIESLGYSELDQDRLGRMFTFYNEHWREYYGTEKVFSIE